MASTPYYLSSNLVNVFPSTRRTYSQEFSPKLMTELSISRMINMLMHTEGFVISQLLTNQPFEINIHGYYFQIEDSNDIISLFDSSTTDTIYASILIEHSNQYPELRVPAELNSGSSPDEYNPAVNYVAGQIIIYDGIQYQCISPTTGTWDPSKWFELTGEFQGLIFTSSIPSKSDILVDGEDLTKFSLYTLPIIEKIANTSPVEWKIPDGSRFWFDLSEIDGGVI